MLAVVILCTALAILRLSRKYYYAHVFIPTLKTYETFISDTFSPLALMLESELDFAIPGELVRIQNELIESRTIITDYQNSSNWLKRFDACSIVAIIIELLLVISHMYIHNFS